MALKVVLRNIAILLLVILSPFLLFLLVVIVDDVCSPPPPSDDEMIAVLTERRAAFDALIAKVDESHATGHISIYKHRGEMKHTDAWAAEMRALMRAAGVNDVVYQGPKFVIQMNYDVTGLFKNRTYKEFKYYPDPIQPPHAVIDLHRDDVADVARAALCYEDRRTDLRSLCHLNPWVNDLDVLNRYDNTDSDWEAERQIDDHWSLWMWHSR